MEPLKSALQLHRWIGEKSGTASPIKSPTDCNRVGESQGNSVTC